MDRGAWWATVHTVEKNQTQLKQLSTQIYKASPHLIRTSVVLSEECIPLVRKDNSGEYTIKKPHGICRGRREWQPTPVFLPGEFHGQRSLVGYSSWGHKELDTTEWLTHLPSR